uniref:Partial AB-hydrolase lipase domain-containing protein n=1 Tax=Chromera velia CCMP2878 TaxID=1169474 RepID=A0A0G4HYI8_9ALVE|eukprot:Cvel_33613.t1-p1 / transcript=Cvel_33613.t1 / gene=Cvel_33613 / organism=Chromera_velia_CCMP2878 / gene_product=Probable lipase C16A3.12c, putative / transcript_product=Probable lipase C16A3.12c, putative / location=Cvel_scaffold5503:565-1341(-) / protein_length=259 / sequence_SO=supercontig / SO=protein_coding / is_pseudo=false
MNTTELIERAGYECEDHFAETSDGFFLVLHRIKGNEGRPPLIFMHGLMMCDEVWVFEKRFSLPIFLHEKGYDVWLCNNRGNKYSWMHQRLNRAEEKYWDYSIDELARYDVPTCVDYVINSTQMPQVGYVGFSNGTAQMFAALSSTHKLNDHISVFIAIAPACKLLTINDKGGGSLLYPLVTTRRSFFTWIFGKRSMLSTSDVWRRYLNVDMLVQAIDLSLVMLFGWHTNNCAPDVKPLFYSHLYSTVSTKSGKHRREIR